MSFFAVIPRDKKYLPTEQSRLTSQREPNSLGHIWKRTRQSQQHVKSGTNIISQLQRRIAKLEQNQGIGLSGLFPFKIYQFPSYLRKFQNDDDWRRFKVRNSPMGILGGMNGTDLEPYPYIENYISFQTPPPDSTAISNDHALQWSEAIIPADDNYYFFWASVCDAGEGSSNPPVIRYGPEQDSGDDCPCIDMWSGESVVEPKFNPLFGSDPYRLVIGWVRIPTDNSDPNEPANVPLVQQTNYGSDERPFLRNDVFFTRGYINEWDSSTQYCYGDEVTITDGGGTFLYHFFLSTNDTYSFTDGPLVNINPITTTPDNPWVMLAKSDIT